MKKLLLLLFGVSLIGCASMPDKDYVMDSATYYPEEEFYQGMDYKVFVKSNKDMLADKYTKVNIHMLAKPMTERALLNAGLIALTKVEENSDYTVEVIVETANLGEKSTDGQSYSIASVAGRVRIYNSKNGQILKDIPFHDNAREVSVKSRDKDLLFNEALLTAIGYQVLTEFRKFFVPKGIVLDGQRVGGTLLLNVMLRGGLVEDGHKVEVFSIEKIKSQFVKSEQYNHKRICEGEVRDGASSDVVIVEVEELCDVKKGNYVAVSESQGFWGNLGNSLGTSFNKAFRKNPIK